MYWCDLFVLKKILEGAQPMSQVDVQEATLSTSLLMDSKLRAQVRRTDPYEVRGAYIWAKMAATHPLLAGVEDMRLVALSPLAALVREETALSLGKAMKHAGINERHVRRLLAAARGDIDEQLAKMVRLLGNKVNIADLVSTCIYWGEKTGRRVAIDYFGLDKDESST